ncbi:4Fe-4S ferredoxin [Nautilia sp. PV-1]|jgi:ferredoxin-type protein NapF|uniref:4Fe-4S dicluster domain-containing protein n=1 Tax=Nautilia sp. PV-1 TaxID=2579250 RepID=UPI000FD716B0|nr:4Fe-4S dicluster domain-containing protein [Nautilia sp. PV-1]AZV46252.1 4Fe-4S ferredoxin [Nautilia sp. PV-1]
MDRRSFFGRVKSSPFKSFVYPPYYDKKEDFLKCLECESKDCLLACKEKIINTENGYPILDFSSSGCTFCDECAYACPKGILSIVNKKETINAQMIINPKKCIAWNQTICFSCQDICEEYAIIYKGMFNPVIDLDKCTGCGFCVSVCPTDAIEIKTL